MSVAPPGSMEVQVVLCDRLGWTVKDFEKAFIVEEYEGYCVVKQKGFLERAVWTKVFDAVNEMDGRYLAGLRAFEIHYAERGSHEKMEQNLEANVEAGEQLTKENIGQSQSTVLIQKPEELEWQYLVDEGIKAREMKDGMQWLLGDLALTVKKEYGENKLGEYAKKIKTPYSTLRTYKRTAEVFKNDERSSFLSWSHHYIATRTNVPKIWLEKAKENSWSVEELEKAIKIHKLRERYGTFSQEVEEFLLDHEMLRSLVSYVDRGPFGDPTFKGNASGWLLVQLIQHFQPKSVYDPMEGSGTSKDVCEGMKTKYIGNDLLNKGYDLVTVDLNQIPTNDLTYFHPPYHNIIKYTDHPNDLSNQPTYKDYLEKLVICVDKLLKRTKILAVLVGDTWLETHFIAFDIYVQYRERFLTRLIKAQHSVGSGFADKKIKEKNPLYIPIRHEDVLILKGDLG